MLKFTIFILSIIAISLPLTAGIKCYVNDLQHEAPDCTYCGFANVTSNNNAQGASQYVTYNCLYDTNYEIKGVKSTAVNKCQVDVSEGTSPSLHSAILVCDKDLYNESCYSAASSVQVSNVLLLGFGVLVAKRQLFNVD